jgi:hypothetical protein
MIASIIASILPALRLGLANSYGRQARTAATPMNRLAYTTARMSTRR